MRCYSTKYTVYDHEAHDRGLKGFKMVVGYNPRKFFSKNGKLYRKSSQKSEDDDTEHLSQREIDIALLTHKLGRRPLDRELCEFFPHRYKNVRYPLIDGEPVMINRTSKLAHLDVELLSRPIKGQRKCAIVRTFLNKMNDLDKLTDVSTNETYSPDYIKRFVSKRFNEQRSIRQVAQLLNLDHNLVRRFEKGTLVKNASVTEAFEKYFHM